MCQNLTRFRQITPASLCRTDYEKIRVEARGSDRKLSPFELP